MADYTVYLVERFLFTPEYRRPGSTREAYTYATMAQLTAYGIKPGRTDLQASFGQDPVNNGTYIVTPVQVKDYNLDEFSKVALVRYHSKTPQILNWISDLDNCLYAAGYSLISGVGTLAEDGKTLTYPSWMDIGALIPNSQVLEDLLKHVPFNGKITLRDSGHTSLTVTIGVD